MEELMSVEEFASLSWLLTPDSNKERQEAGRKLVAAYAAALAAVKSAAASEEKS